MAIATNYSELPASIKELLSPATHLALQEAKPIKPSSVADVTEITHLDYRPSKSLPFHGYLTICTQTTKHETFINLNRRFESSSAQSAEQEAVYTFSSGTKLVLTEGELALINKFLGTMFQQEVDILVDERERKEYYKTQRVDRISVQSHSWYDWFGVDDSPLLKVRFRWTEGTSSSNSPHTPHHGYYEVSVPDTVQSAESAALYIHEHMKHNGFPYGLSVANIKHLANGVRLHFN